MGPGDVIVWESGRKGACDDQGHRPDRPSHRSLWAPVLAHALNNLLGFLALRNGWLALPSEQGSEGGDG